MGETSPFRFPGNLDPSAQEFRPAKNVDCQPQFPLFRPPQLYFPHAAPPTAYMAVAAPQQPLPPPTAAATRALVLTLVPFDVSESKVRKELEVFGELRGVQMERIREGIMTVHFYDLRHAEAALKEIREQHMQHQTRVPNQYIAGVHPNARGLIAGRPVWAHFIIPASNGGVFPEGNNQGTVVVFNLDPSVSISELTNIFQAYGPVKEVRETPLKKHQKFVEFYDVRDSVKALREMNGKEINGKKVVIQFSRPGGYSRNFFNGHHHNKISTFTHKYNYQYHTTTPNYLYPPPPPQPPLSLPLNFSYRLSSNNIIHRSFLCRSQLPTTKVLSSSTKGNPNGNSNINRSVVETEPVENKVGGGCGSSRKSTAKKNQSSQQQCRGKLGKCRKAKKFDPRFLICEDAMVCKDSRTTLMIKNIPNKYSQKLFLNMLDNHCIHCNEQIADGDDQPLSSYDFVYLPVDFNNKCNVGYGFVNMTSPQATWRLYKAFHHQHWEVFNSRKICEVSYARVQGLKALKEHFSNSKFACEMNHYLPVVFSPPRDGKQLTEAVPIAGQKQQSFASNDHSVDDKGFIQSNPHADDGTANSAQQNNGTKRLQVL